MHLRKLCVAVVVFALAGMLAACTNQVCTPGETESCACPGGYEGIQTCREDGSGFEQCRCGPGQRPDGWTPDDGGMSEGDTAGPSDAGSTEETEDGSAGSDGGGAGDTQTGEEGPKLVVDSRVVFDSVAPGSRASQRVPLANEGAEPLAIEEVELTGSSQFTVTVAVDQSTGGEGDAGAGGAPDPDLDEPISALDNSSLSAGESVDLRVYFEPEDDQPAEADLEISSDAPARSETVVSISGNLGSPCLETNVGSELDFEQVSTDGTATRTVSIENCRSIASDLVVQNIELTDDAGGAFGLREDSLPDEISDGMGYTLEDDERLTFVVEFAPSDLQSYNGKLRIDSNDPAAQTREIDVVGRGVDSDCPTAEATASVAGGGASGTQIDTRPLATITFDGTASSYPNGSIDRYEWSIIDRPADSTAHLTPGANSAQPEMFLDLAGQYTVELVVYADGQQNCGDRALIEIDATPEQDIHVQLVWNTPGDPDQSDSSGTDMDLHYLHSTGTAWNQAPWDVFWNNDEPDWGTQGDSSDDPSLDVADGDGAGPEILNHDNPSSDPTYTVGVYYFDANGYGPSYATVRIYLEGTLEREYKNKFLADTYDFWEVAEIDWSAKEVLTRDETYEDFPSSGN